MKTTVLKFMSALMILSAIFVSCSKKSEEPDIPKEPIVIVGDEDTEERDISDYPKGGVLMLMVDYTTNSFEYGNNLALSDDVSTFSISTNYKSPGDFGYIKLFYPEVNKMIFHGTIIWNGCGNVKYPENWTNAKRYTFTETTDWMYPLNGFENIGYGEFEKTTLDESHNAAWTTVQKLIVVRNYLSSNPDQKVKVLFYRPSVGIGDPKDWKWIFFLKK